MDFEKKGLKILPVPSLDFVKKYYIVARLICNELMVAQSQFVKTRYRRV